MDACLTLMAVKIQVTYCFYTVVMKNVDRLNHKGHVVGFEKLVSV